MLVSVNLLLALMTYWQFWVIVIAGTAGMYITERFETYKDSKRDWVPHINGRQDDKDSHLW